MDKYTKAHNKMVFATGEHKTRAKLAKSKHGWLKIAMGVTFASTSLFAVSHPTHAETQTPVKDAAVSAPANHQEAGTTETPTDNGSNQTDSTTEQEAVAPTDQTKSVTEQTNKQPSDEPAATTDSKKDQQPNVATEPSQPSATKEQDLTDQSVGTDGTATAETNQLADQPTTSDAATNTVAPNEEKQTSVVEPTKTETNTNSTDPNTTDQQVKTNDQSTVTTDEHPVTSNQADVKSTDHQQTEPVTQQTATPVISLAAADTNSVSGTYTVSGTQNVRDGAGLGYNVTGQLNAGDTINYDGQQSADGYTWLHYTNYAGQDRWVAQLVSATNNHSAFIDSLAAGAIETWNRYGVLPSVSIAQAIVESGWGGSAPGNNLFGIKGEYNGQYTIQKTQEFVNGRYITIYDKFRAYPSFAESIMDHGNFLYVNSRYANLLGVRDAYQVTQMLQRDGYATSPTYASTLMSVINANNLTRFDQNLGTPTGGATNNNQGDSTVTNDVSGSYTLPGAQNVRDGA
ncbi:glycoside hydrolase family 73 protein, partial [Fructilactobacillus florum]